jgi:hypothetical protein
MVQLATALPSVEDMLLSFPLTLSSWMGMVLTFKSLANALQISVEENVLSK